jgi:hypothetical protein
VISPGPAFQPLLPRGRRGPESGALRIFWLPLMTAQPGAGDYRDSGFFLCGTETPDHRGDLTLVSDDSRRPWHHVVPYRPINP